MYQKAIVLNKDELDILKESFDEFLYHKNPFNIDSDYNGYYEIDEKENKNRNTDSVELANVTSSLIDKIY